MLLLFWKVCHDVGISTPLGIRVACAAGKKTRRLEVEFSIYFFCLFSYHVPYIYLTDWAKTQGQPKDEALIDEFLNNVPSGGRQSEEPSFLLSIVGILNTLGVVRWFITFDYYGWSVVTQ